MMKQTNSQKCNSYGKAVVLKETASAKAMKDFGGKQEKDWKVRIRLRSAGHFDVVTYKHVAEPKKKQEEETKATQK